MYIYTIIRKFNPYLFICKEKTTLFLSRIQVLLSFNISKLPLLSLLQSKIDKINFEDRVLRNRNQIQLL